MKLVVFDIETTGTDKEKDHIIQFSAIKYDKYNPGNPETYSTYIKPTGPYTMSVAALSKHNLTPKFLEDKPEFVEVAQDILDFISGCALLTYNGLSFDAPILKRHFKEVGIDWHFADIPFYDSFLEEKRRNSHKLEETYKRYMGTAMADDGLNAHDALSDCFATLSIFLEQQKIQQFNPEDILTEDGFIKMMDFSGKDTECFAVGKWSGVSVEYVAKYDKSYINWVLNSPGFDQKTKLICESYLQ